MDVGALAFSLFVTFFIGFGIMGIRYFIRDSQSKSYCNCRHEWQEHYIVPIGMKNPMDAEVCKECSCKAFKRNDKDKRNTPPISFW